MPLVSPPPFPAHLPVLRAPVELRFEDVSQDGRLALQAIPSALGGTLWNPAVTTDPLRPDLMAQGIVPILSRYQIAGYDGPISAVKPLDATWAHQLARTDQGRFTYDAWLDLHGARGLTYGSVEGAGERLLVGRLYVEQVLTRPFAPAGQRRVTETDVAELLPGMPWRAEHAPAARLLDLPEGATALEQARSPDEVSTVLGLMHTDTNQHVNSLVYFRLFEEAALRRLERLGRATDVLGRELELVYRKPCFAGQRVRVVQQSFEHEGAFGVCSMLVDEAVAQHSEQLAQAKPYAYARLLCRK